jgi:hypothetical protein
MQQTTPTPTSNSNSNKKFVLLTFLKIFVLALFSIAITIGLYFLIKSYLPTPIYPGPSLADPTSIIN